MAVNLPIADKFTLDAVNINVGSEADAASAAGSVHAKLKDIKSNLANSSIKSIQRGILAKQTIAADTSVDVIISSVIPSKTIINIPVLTTGDGRYNLYAYLTSNTKLTFKSDAQSGWVTTSGSVAWEVIEFY